MRLQIPKQPRIQWNSPINDYDILTDDSCKLIFEQSKSYFEETIEESEELTQRSTRMLFLFLPAIAAVIGYCISHEEKLKPLDNFGIMLILSITGCAVNCAMNLFKLISPKKGHYRGGKPEEIMRKEIFQLRHTLHVQKALYISEIERYQVKIEQMEYWNYKRILLYSEVIYSFNTMLFIGIILLIRSI